MIIKANETKRGINIIIGERSSNINYPNDVWKKFPKNMKEVLIDNLAYSKTMITALVDGIEDIHYETSMPLLKSFFDACCIKDIPRMPLDKNNGLKTEEVIKKFINTQHHFQKDEIKYPYYDAKAETGAITAMSFGKDSLLSYALLEEAEIQQQAVYIKDMFDYEAELKDDLKTKFEKEFKTQIEVIEDDSDKLFLGKHDQFNPLLTNAINSYVLMLLPFAYHKECKYIVFGNEKNLNNYFINKDGYKGYASYDQTAEWVKQQTAFMGILTSNKIKVFSPIEPITNLATMKILNERYPKYAKYQITCPLEDSKKGEKWCGNCSECAKIYAIMKALNIDVKKRGFKKDMLTKQYKSFYML
ncbi:MAG: hypothetical protein QW404_02430, partial [Candidatus Nanoarchaeia archaeon]